VKSEEPIDFGCASARKLDDACTRMYGEEGTDFGTRALAARFCCGVDEASAVRRAGTVRVRTGCASPLAPVRPARANRTNNLTQGAMCQRSLRGGFGECAAVEGETRDGGRVCSLVVRRHQVEVAGPSEKGHKETFVTSCGFR
jgi:hypothetical protein